jgi:uncharacterized protein YcfJ
MKKLVLASMLAAVVGSSFADTYFDEARVRGVEPRYESVAVPRQECAKQVVMEVQRVDAGRDYGGAVIGGVAGALLGNQVGRGHGREAATALGAVVGAFTGDNLVNQGRYPQYQEVPREVTTCRTVTEMQSRISGYRVDYEYRGRMYSTFMHDEPGPALRVRVSVDPA